MRVFLSLLRKALQTSATKSPIPQPVPTTQKGSVLFGKYLLATNTISSGFLMSAGDLIVQEYEFQNGTLKNRYDWKRSGKENKNSIKQQMGYRVSEIKTMKF